MEQRSADQALRNTLIEQIRTAFDGVKRGDTATEQQGITLQEARVLDDYGTPEERGKAREADTTTKWQDVPDGWIEEYYDTLCFLTPESLAYYLPAFMIWSLRYYDSQLPGRDMPGCLFGWLRPRKCVKSDYPVSDYTIYQLTVTDPKAYPVERYEVLSAEQKKATAEFLDYFAKGFATAHVHDPEAQKALDLYWGQFL